MAKTFPSLNFKVSAPGKVILHGEHSVVYGKPALAGVVGARNTLYINEDTESSTVSLRFETLKLNVEIDIEEINQLITKLKECNSLDFTSTLEIVSNYVETKYKYLSADDERKTNTLKAVLYLFCGILLEKNIFKISNGFNAELKSTLSIGAGLGSSASFAVCLAAGFLILTRKYSLPRGNENILDFTTGEKDFISKWAFNSEKLMHGTPSGIDNTVCTFGNIVKFTKGKEPSQVVLKSKFPVLLVDTKVTRSTAKLVAKVADLKATFPKIIENILNSMEEVVNEAIPLYENYLPTSDVEFKKIEQLFHVNNSLLRAIDVSHPRLENIFMLATKYGFSSKLTGAGGGGFALILLPHDYLQKDVFKSLCNELTQNEYSFIETTIGGPGVKIEQTII